jgi:hypothetical protein
MTAIGRILNCALVSVAINARWLLPAEAMLGALVMSQGYENRRRKNDRL